MPNHHIRTESDLAPYQPLLCLLILFLLLVFSLETMKKETSRLETMATQVVNRLQMRLQNRIIKFNMDPKNFDLISLQLFDFKGIGLKDLILTDVVLAIIYRIYSCYDTCTRRPDDVKFCTADETIGNISVSTGSEQNSLIPAGNYGVGACLLEPQQLLTRR